MEIRSAAEAIADPAAVPAPRRLRGSRYQSSDRPGPKGTGDGPIRLRPGFDSKEIRKEMSKIKKARRKLVAGRDAPAPKIDRSKLLDRPKLLDRTKSYLINEIEFRPV